MKCKAVLGLLALIVTLVLSATAAQAGAGGTPSALTSFFACYTIKAGDAGKVVDLEIPAQSPIANPDPALNVQTGVRIGNGSLACAIVKLLVPSKQTDQFYAEPNPQNAMEPNAIKCYTVSSPGGTIFPGPSGLPYAATDALGEFGDLVTGELGTEEGIQVSQLKYICGPAEFTQPLPQ